MRQLTVVAAYVLLLGMANAGNIPDDYAGQDAGKIVLGIGTTTGTDYSSYTFLFRGRTALPNEKKAATGSIQYKQIGAFGRQPTDYKSESESGIVLTHSLPSGDYEIYNFEIFQNHGLNQVTFGSRTNFSIPFSVQSGRVTYLGNYQANGLKGKNFLGISMPAGAVFIVTNRLNSDLAIAQKKSGANIDGAINATPDPNKVGNPYIVSPDESREEK